MELLHLMACTCLPREPMAMLLLCLLQEVASDKGRERAGVRELAHVTLECVRRMADIGPRLSVCARTPVCLCHV